MTENITSANVREDENLLPLLHQAAFEDLSILYGYITDDGKGRISVGDSILKRLESANSRGEFDEEEICLIAEQIQLFGGNSIVNLARRQGVVYQEILEDVASRLKVLYSKDDPVSVIENNILVALASRAWDKMTDQEKLDFVKSAGIDLSLGIGPAALTAVIAVIRSTGFAAYKLAVIVANIIARQLLGRGLAVTTMAPFLKGMSAFTGPIGWAITAMWSAYDFASPGYRVTIPCVIQLAYMRKKQFSVVCSSCKSPNVMGTKFCSECGNKLTP